MEKFSASSTGSKLSGGSSCSVAYAATGSASSISALATVATNFAISIPFLRTVRDHSLRTSAVTYKYKAPICAKKRQLSDAGIRRGEGAGWGDGRGDGRAAAALPSRPAAGSQSRGRARAGDAPLPARQARGRAGDRERAGPRAHDHLPLVRLARRAHRRGDSERGRAAPARGARGRAREGRQGAARHLRPLQPAPRRCPGAATV